MKFFLPMCLFVVLLGPRCGWAETTSYTTISGQVFSQQESELDAVAIVTAKARQDLFQTIGRRISQLKVFGTAPTNRNFFEALALGITHVDQPTVSIRRDVDTFEVKVEVEGSVDDTGLQENSLKFEASRFRFGNALATRESAKMLFHELEQIRRTHETLGSLRSQADGRLQEARIISDRHRLAQRLAALTINEQIISAMVTDNDYVDSARALKELYKAIDLDSNNEWLFLHRGQVEGNLMDTEAAAWDFDRAIQINPYSPKAHYFRGRLLLGKQNFEGAVSDFNQSIALDTRSELPFFYRGQANKMMNKLNLAIIDFTRAIQKNQKNHAVYVERGMAYNETGAYENAIKDFDAAIALAPNNAGIYIHKGQAQSSAGTKEAACDSFRSACRLGDCSGIRRPAGGGICNTPNREEALAWSRISYRYVADKKWPDAIIAASLAMSYGPEMVDPYINRAWAYAETGDYEEAIQDCNTALSLAPNRAEIFNNRGLAYHRKGSLPEAVRDYLKACQLGLKVGCQNYLEIKQAPLETVDKSGQVDNLLRKSADRFKQKDWQAVLQITGRVLSIDPDNPIAHANRSAVFSYTGQLDSAVEEADKAIKMNSKFGLAYNNRGYALELMGRTIDAIVDYRLGCLYNSNTACDNYSRLKPKLR